MKLRFTSKTQWSDPCPRENRVNVRDLQQAANPLNDLEFVRHENLNTRIQPCTLPLFLGLPGASKRHERKLRCDPEIDLADRLQAIV
jgi:hypothetical protein